MNIRLKRAGSKTSDTQALNQIAVYMGSQESWDGGDVCEIVAEIVASTGRPPVGDQSPADLAMYRRWADRLGWQHDGDE